MICDDRKPHDPHPAVNMDDMGHGYICEGRTAPAVPQELHGQQPRLAVDIARENLTQAGKEAIEAYLEAERELASIEWLARSAKSRLARRRDEMLAALIAMPAGANNATPGMRITDYIDVVKFDRRNS